MSRFGLAVVVLAFAAALVACSDANGTSPGPDPGGVPDVRLEVVASGLEHPLFLTAPAGDERLFIVEQPGRIRIVEDGRLLPEPFLDITDKVSSGGERGLLGLAFHPNYAENGYFYVNYTDRNGDTRVVRYTAEPGSNTADPASAKLILTVDQPFPNHNGGMIAFGPDGMLYIALGDGGGAGDPYENGQDPTTLLGSLLRIDVDGGDPYAIPPDNPFAGEPGPARGEIWAYGLRNPWRFSFDPATGLLYIADVGQNAWEEINIQPADAAGLNYGWDIMEGRHCFQADSCDRSGLVLPALEYSHDEGCSITGGYVYRGSALPALQGHYFYSDFCAGFIRSFKYEDGRVTDRRQWALGDIGRVLSFGVDAAGELYVLSANGKVYKFVPDE